MLQTAPCASPRRSIDLEVDLLAHLERLGRSGALLRRRAGEDLEVGRVRDEDT
jgi:hypothetical protein